MTAASSSGAPEDTKSQDRTADLRAEHDRAPGDGVHGSEAARSPTDTHRNCKENDKENDQSGTADSAVEAVKRKVVEAPPPKVNPWTKRTTGRVPSSNINSSNSQEKGEPLSWLLIK